LVAALARVPQLFGNRHWLDLHVRPPGLLVAVPMQILVVSTAEWHCEFVANLAAQGSCLGELEVVRV
jgi:hypothetical protein